MCLGRGGILVINIGRRGLQDRPGLGRSIIGDLVGLFGAVVLGELELGGVVLNGGIQLFLELTAQADAVLHRGDDEAADIAHVLAAGLDRAILINRIVGAIGAECGLVIGIGLQGGILDVKAEFGLVAVDDVLVGNGQQRTLGGDGVEIRALAGDGVLDILVLKIRGLGIGSHLAIGQHELRLLNGG